MIKRVLGSIALSIIIMMSVSGCSSKMEVNPHPAPDEDSLEYVKKKWYEQGYEDAKRELKEIYIKEGFNRAKKILKDYTDKIKAYEAGKYAIKEKLVTWPEIVAIENSDGSIKIESLGCQIKEEVTPSQLIKFYRDFKPLLPVKKEQKKSNTDKDGTKNISGITTMGLTDSYIKTTQDYVSNYTAVFQKTYKMKKIIDDFGLNCNDANNMYLCIFDNKQEYLDFCKATKVCKGM